jgi:hypothetical protein
MLKEKEKRKKGDAAEETLIRRKRINTSQNLYLVIIRHYTFPSHHHTLRNFTYIGTFSRTYIASFFFFFFSFFAPYFTYLVGMIS